MEAVEKPREVGMETHVNSPSERAMFGEETQATVVEFLAGQVGHENVDKVFVAAQAAEEKIYDL